MKLRHLIIRRDSNHRKRETMTNIQFTALGRVSLVSVAALTSFVSLSFAVVTGPATAKPLSAGALACSNKFNACQSRCESRIPKGIPIQKANDLLFACTARTCNRQHDNCMANLPNAGRGGQKTQRPGSPLNPKGAGNRTPPTGGTSSNPKSPPRVNDTRLPPRGGVHGSKTTGAGTGGPILRSNASSGSSFRSSGRR
jgi:hypothetical protein